MKRKLSLHKYIVAAIITCIIFGIGLSSGLLVERGRLKYIQEMNTEQKIDYSSLQLQFLYLDSLKDNKSCPAVYKIFNTNLDLLDRTRKRLEDYNQKSAMDKENFDLLQREYFIAEMRYWLLSQKVREICNEDIVTVLYFYSDSAESDTQGFILNYLKRKLKEQLLIFSFNSQFEKEPIIPILLTRHNLTEYPALVIENETFQGIVPESELNKIICSHYNSEPEQCM